MEVDSARSLTKKLHASTKALGAAKKELAQLRQARATHTASWQEFVIQATQAIEKGHALYETRQAEFMEKERAVTEKVAAARRELKELTSKSADTAEANTANAAEAIGEDDSEIEMLPVTSVDEATSSDVQATKKLRTALQSVCARLPAPDDDTPKRRTKPEAPPA